MGGRTRGVGSLQINVQHCISRLGMMLQVGIMAYASAVLVR